MAESKKVPELRFKGFTDDWEQRKLGDYIKDSGDRTSDFGKYPLYSLTIENGVTPKTQRYERGFLVTKEDDLFKIVEPGNFVTNPMNLRFGAAGYNKESFPVSVSGYYDVFEIDENLCGGFWNSYFRSSTGLKKFDDVATGSLLEKRRVHFSELKKAEFAVPRQMDERKAIGKLLECIDFNINLYQCKFERLFALKNSMLEKMFPKPGWNVPEVRFAGFTGDWKKCALSSFAEEVTRTNPESTAPIMMITANDGFIEQSDRYAFNNAGNSLKKYIILREGELAYNHGASKLRPYGSCFALTSVKSARIPFVYHCFSVGGNVPEFISIELNSNQVASQLRRIVSSGARMDGLLNISFEEYGNVGVLLPSIPEQKRIAAYFRQLDALITLHQRKCEALKQLKQSLLEKMFV